MVTNTYTTNSNQGKIDEKNIIITCCDLNGIDIVGFNYVKQKVLLVDFKNINNHDMIKDVIKELSNIAYGEVVFR